MSTSFVYAAGENGMLRAKILAFDALEMLTVQFPDLTIKTVPINSTIFIGENHEGESMYCRNCNKPMYFAGEDLGRIHYYCENCGRDIYVRNGVVVEVNNYGRKK